MKNIKVRELLKKYNSLTEEMEATDYHMRLLKDKINDLKIKIPELREKSEEEIVNYFIDVYQKCDASNPEYDLDLDIEMTRIGLRTDDFWGGHSHSTYCDDFGVGNPTTSLYDDYVDLTNDEEHFSTLKKVKK